MLKEKKFLSNQYYNDFNFKKVDFRRIISTAIRNKSSFEEIKKLDWITQAANGLQDIHKLNYVHRDIKPEYFSFI